MVAALLRIALAAVGLCETGARARATQKLSAWAGVSSVDVASNAPVLRWDSGMMAEAARCGKASGVDVTADCTAVVALRVNVSMPCPATAGKACGQLWSTGDMRTNLLSTWLGLAVYEGPPLHPSTSYVFTVEERIVVFSNGTRGPAQHGPRGHFAGTFSTSATLPSARDEAATVMSSANVTALWNGSWNSVVDRTRPNGFLPTSVSGGYGGISQQFVRDASGQIIGMIQLGPRYYPKAAQALRFMLGQLSAAYQPGASFLSYAPHVMQANANLTKIKSFDTRDQTDDSFYLMAAWGLYTNRTGDTSLEREYYSLMRDYANHYLGPGAKSLGFGGTPSKPEHGGGVRYWNASLSLVWNANLEHSRLGSYWSCYDTLSNSFAVEGLRALERAATRLGLPAAEASQWGARRKAILKGMDTSLTVGGSAPVVGLAGSIYGELLGHENGFVEDGAGASGGPARPSPLLWGLSYENIVPAVIALTQIGSSADLGNSTHPTDSRKREDAAIAALGLDQSKLDRTWDAVRRVGAFQWINTDPELSAFVATTHINASGLLDPPPPHHDGPAPGPPPVVTPCSPGKWLIGADALTLGSGLDICNPREAGASCSKVADVASCCAACTADAAGCGAWFWNGATKLCGGHGCCYMKGSATPDKVTPPSPHFAAGHGPRRPGSSGGAWCAYSGSFNTPNACPAYAGKTCACGSFAMIGKALGWELGWAAHKRHYSRLISLHRMLGQAAHVEQTKLFGESYSYQCIKDGEAHGFAPFTPKNARGAGCWGDPGNGVQIGWFLWGEAMARVAVGLPAT